MVDKLQRGATVADVGCGHGASTIVMAQAFPNSNFIGFDYHSAVRRSAARPLARRESEHAAASKLPARPVFPATATIWSRFFDCLHDMGDPVGVANMSGNRCAGRHMADCRAVRRKPCRRQPQPYRQVFYAASTMICVPASLSQEVGMALGAQAGKARLRTVVTTGGFTRFRRAASTPFNLVLEARP